MTDPALSEAMAEFQRCVENRDVDRAGHVLDDDFALVLVQPAPATMPRERWLGLLPDYVVHDYRVEEASVEFDPEDADLAVSIHRDAMRATVLREDRSGLFVVSDVWRRRNGTWKLWRRHSTPLSVGVMPSNS